VEIMTTEGAAQAGVTWPPGDGQRPALEKHHSSPPHGFGHCYASPRKRAGGGCLYMD